jgi:hypothetical protein
MNHSLESPFPHLLRDRLVIDELCACGRRRSEHADTLAWGHGAAEGCRKFTWIGFIYGEEGR